MELGWVSQILKVLGTYFVTINLNFKEIILIVNLRKKQVLVYVRKQSARKGSFSLCYLMEYFFLYSLNPGTCLFAKLVSNTILVG